MKPVRGILAILFLFVGVGLVAGCGDDATPACNGVVCDNPPDPECVDDSTLREYDATGTCVGGDCNYDYTDTNCPGGCANAACQSEEECEGVDCDDDNPCTNDVCVAGECEYTNNTDACDDGNQCTENDVCAGGSCEGGDPVDCNDDNMCTDDACDPDEGCVNTNNTLPCDDGQECSTNDHCLNGVCIGDTSLECDDGNICTEDTCDDELGCVYVNNTRECDDGDACTTGDVCADGECGSTGVLDCDDGNVCTDDDCHAVAGCTHVNNAEPCDDGDACTMDDVCAAGACAPGAAVDCDDGNPCTEDSCDPASGCVHTNLSGACDDGNACTDGDTCVDGACQPGTALVCDDDNLCTDDSCDPATGCVHTNNSLPCDDGQACSTNDTCVNGVCVGETSLECDDGNPCTEDTCNDDTGCVHINNTAPCDDNDACTSGDVCSEGSCQSGAAIDCDDSDPCTTDSCDTATGCVNTPIYGPGACDYNGTCIENGMNATDCASGEEAWTCTDGVMVTTHCGTDFCNDTGDLFGGGTCNAVDYFCADGQCGSTQTGQDDHCAASSTDAHPILVYYTCQGGNTCIPNNHEQLDVCEETGGELGGGDCTATNWTCAGGVLEYLDTAGVDTCGGTTDNPEVTVWSCQDGNTCIDAITRRYDECEDDGDDHGGGVCTANDWVCQGGELRFDYHQMTDTCGGTEDDPNVTYYFCSATDGTVDDTCTAAVTTENDGCEDSGGAYGGGGCQADNWTCDSGLLTNSPTTGDDTCGGTADNPNVTYWSCGTADGSRNDHCYSDLTSESDTCSDTGGAHGGGSCSATDWDCTDGLLASSSTSGTDVCSGADNPEVDYYSCAANDGSINDECRMATTNEADSCTDSGDAYGGGSCSASNWWCDGSVLTETATNWTDNCVGTDVPEVTYASCVAADGSVADHCGTSVTTHSDSCDDTAPGSVLGGGHCSATRWYCSEDPSGDSLLSTGTSGSDTCASGTDVDSPTITYWECTSGDGSAEDTCTSAVHGESDTCVDTAPGSILGGGFCDAVDWDCVVDAVGNDDRLQRIDTNEDDDCIPSEFDSPMLTYYECRSTDGTADDQCYLAGTTTRHDGCEDSGDTFGGGTCAAVDWYCVVDVDPQGRADQLFTRNGDMVPMDDTCTGADSPVTTYYTCTTFDGSVEDTCTDATTTRSDSCTDTGDNLGGGICSGTNWYCDGNTLTHDDTSGTDTCTGDDDNPRVEYWNCYAADGTAGDSCNWTSTLRQDTCADTGGIYGGGSCTATDWDCVGTPGQLVSSVSSGEDYCDSPDPDSPTIYYYGCGASDGSVPDVCGIEGFHSESDDCTDSAPGSIYGGGDCSAVDWYCQVNSGPDHLLSTSSSGVDTCSGDDNPLATYYECQNNDGAAPDTCTANSTSRNDSCSDSGNNLGGGSCDATDWYCVDGNFLTSSSTSETDTCGGTEDNPSVTYHNCYAADGTAGDSCNSTMTIRADSCTDDGAPPNYGGSCSAVNWWCQALPGGDQLQSNTSEGTDECIAGPPPDDLLYWSCTSVDGGTVFDTCQSGSANCTSGWYCDSGACVMTKFGEARCHFLGISDDNEGLLAWWADGNGPEERLPGYELPAPYNQCHPIAFPYLASPDHDAAHIDIGPTTRKNPTAAAGHALDPIEELPGFAEVLSHHGYNPAQFRVSFGLMTLVDGRPGQEYFDGSVETRTYRGGQLTFSVDGHPMITAETPDLTMVINHFEAADCNDDEIIAYTDELTASDLQDVSADAPAGVRSAAQAFIKDIKRTGPVRFMVESIQMSGVLESSETGRKGVMYDVPIMRIE